MDPTKRPRMPNRAPPTRPDRAAGAAPKTEAPPLSGVPKQVVPPVDPGRVNRSESSARQAKVGKYRPQLPSIPEHNSMAALVPPEPRRTGSEQPHMTHPAPEAAASAQPHQPAVAEIAVMDPGTQVDQVLEQLRLAASLERPIRSAAQPDSAAAQALNARNAALSKVAELLLARPLELTNIPVPTLMQLQWHLDRHPSLRADGGRLHGANGPIGELKREFSKRLENLGDAEIVELARQMIRMPETAGTWMADACVRNMSPVAKIKLLVQLDQQRPDQFLRSADPVIVFIHDCFRQSPSQAVCEEILSNVEHGRFTPEVTASLTALLLERAPQLFHQSLLAISKAMRREPPDPVEISEQLKVLKKTQNRIRALDGLPELKDRDLQREMADAFRAEGAPLSPQALLLISKGKVMRNALTNSPSVVSVENPVHKAAHRSVLFASPEEATKTKNLKLLEGALTEWFAGEKRSHKEAADAVKRREAERLANARSMRPPGKPHS
jgi:hypothetical protein